MNSETLWLIVGFAGQGFFSLRFLVQWLHSERQQRSVIPISFWYFSIAGTLTLLTYAIHRADPVFIVGQLTGLFIYLRNLHLINKSEVNNAESRTTSLATKIVSAIRHSLSAIRQSLPTAHFPLFIIHYSLFILLLFLLARPFLPIDETRYLAVAWEMWERGDWLVPHLNGQVYPDKPPLLFWLINAGWALFGVNDWWPHLLPGLFSLGSLLLTIQLARSLWPQLPNLPHSATLILFSSLLWSVFTSLLMFDLLLTCFVLLGMIALVRAWRTPGWKTWGLLGIAIGFGILTKGPVILLHLLPVAFLARWWQDTPPPRHWYLGVLTSVFIGALLALTWAIPAGIMGGAEYREAIFWGQTAHRLVHSFAHQHPFWWYLPLLPILLFPWSLWPPLWRGWRNLPQILNDPGIRFGLTWLLPVFIALSLISGKQAHYLLPLFPAFALLSAYLLWHMPENEKTYRWDNVPPAIFIMLSGLFLLLIPHFQTRLPPFLQPGITELPPWPGIILWLLGGLLILTESKTRFGQLLLLSTVTLCATLLFSFSLLKVTGVAYNIQGISDAISTRQQHGATLAHLGDYHGQYQFLGRLQPLPVVDEYHLCPWLVQHPDSQLIIYFTSEDKGLMNTVDYVQPYRSGYVGIVPGPVMNSVCGKVVP